jgi:hypothetical protein
MSPGHQLWPQIVAFITIWVMFLLIYRYLPPRRIKWNTAAVTAATFTTILGEALKFGFGWYVTGVADFRRRGETSPPSSSSSSGSITRRWSSSWAERWRRWLHAADAKEAAAAADVIPAPGRAVGGAGAMPWMVGTRTERGAS